MSYDYYSELYNLLANYPHINKKTIANQNIKLYAIVHCGASKDVYNEMQYYYPPMKSLYAEKYKEKLYTIAPVLIDLNCLEEINDEFIPYLLTQARIENAVVFFHSIYDFNELYEYFYKLTMASTPTFETLNNEEPMYEENISFFYTAKAFPKHLRSSLINKEKLREYFSPVITYIIPVIDDLSRVYIYSANEDFSGMRSIKHFLLELPNILNISTPKEDYLKIPEHIYITPKQIKVFDTIATEKFIHTFLIELKNDGYVFPYNDKEQIQRAKDAVEVADKLNLKTDGETAHCILINLYLPISLKKQVNFFTEIKKRDTFGERMDLLEKLLVQAKAYYRENTNVQKIS